MGDIKIGDKVETCVWVCGERVPMQTGIVVGIRSGCCDVDIMSLHDGAPWIVIERTDHLRKLEA